MRFLLPFVLCLFANAASAQSDPVPSFSSERDLLDQISAQFAAAAEASSTGPFQDVFGFRTSNWIARGFVGRLADFDGDFSLATYRSEAFGEGFKKQIVAIYGNGHYAFMYFLTHDVGSATLLLDARLTWRLSEAEQAFFDTEPER